ncbi:MAG: MFS transporter [Gammaproteobacteria bacterium]|nr:MAG: MFS transporter [Gammaproteobacteria bacterium]
MKVDPAPSESSSPSPGELPLSLVLRVFIPFAAGYFLSYLYRTINAVLAPELVADLHLDAAALGLLTSVYFLTFAAFQLPLGVLLDRFGPHRVEGLLLLLAAGGATLFAVSGGMEELVLGRALIGLGVSACLMASLKTFVMWFPPQRLPAVNGWVMAFGGLGALMATAPVELALSLTSWRGVFGGLAVLTLALAAILFLVVPDHPPAGGGGNWREQLRGIVGIYTSRVFWRLAPISLLAMSAYMAIQGLWAGPYLRDVGGLDRLAVADLLFWIAAGMVAGFLSMGTLAYRLSHLGIPVVVVSVGGMGVFMALQLVIASGFAGGNPLVWVGFGFFGTAGNLTYAILSQSFPRHLAGRVNTALNLLVFIGAFVLQWGLGAVIGLWPLATGGYALAGYRVAFGAALALQVVALGWFWYASHASRDPGRPSQDNHASHASHHSCRDPDRGTELKP